LKGFSLRGSRGRRCDRRSERQREHSEPWRYPCGDYRFPYRARSSPFGALYAGPYGGKAYIKAALTALRRSFVPICSTRLSHSREGVDRVTAVEEEEEEEEEDREERLFSWSL
jgi:hypothetical protein